MSPSDDQVREWYSKQDFVHCDAVQGGPGTCQKCDEEIAAITALLAEREAALVRERGEAQNVADQYEARAEAAERGERALQSQVGALREALSILAKDEVSICENEEGEEYVQCGRCEGSAWGGDKDDVEHRGDCPFIALAATADAARERDERIRLEEWKALRGVLGKCEDALDGAAYRLGMIATGTVYEREAAAAMSVCSDALAAIWARAKEGK